MRFTFPRVERAGMWSPLGQTLAWTYYQYLLIEQLRNLTSPLWLVGVIYYLKARLRLENGPILLGLSTVLVLSTVVAIPYCWLALRCLAGPSGIRLGPLPMLLGGHARWRARWQDQVVVPTRRLAEQVKLTSAELRETADAARQESLRGPDLEAEVAAQRRVLADLYRSIPQWEHDSLMVGKIREEFSPTFQSEDLAADTELCLANIVHRVLTAFDNILVYRDGPACLVLLVDRRAGRQESKIRVAVRRRDLGGVSQWQFQLANCYFYFPGFARNKQAVVPSEGDLTDVRRALFGNRWTASFRIGVLSLVNPLNLFRLVNLWQGLGWLEESRQQRASLPYLSNHFLGLGDFTDLALINRMRFAAMSTIASGQEYRGQPITTPTERTEKEVEQFTMTLQQVIQAAIREVLDTGLQDDLLLDSRGVRGGST